MRPAYLMLALVAVVVAAAAVIVGAGRSGRTGMTAAWVALLAAVVATVLPGVVLLPMAADDSGLGFAIPVTVGPVVVTALPAVALRLGRLAGVAGAWVAAPLLLAFVVVFALGIGMYYLPAALLVLAAAVLLTGSRSAPRAPAAHSGPDRRE